MPDQHSGGHTPDLPEHAKAYFKRRHKDYNELPASTLEVFATLSAQEVDALDRVGVTLEDEGADFPQYTCALH